MGGWILLYSFETLNHVNTGLLLTQSYQSKAESNSKYSYFTSSLNLNNAIFFYNCFMFYYSLL